VGFCGRGVNIPQAERGKKDLKGFRGEPGRSLTKVEEKSKGTSLG